MQSAVVPPISPHISPYLPISPHISLEMGVLCALLAAAPPGAGATIAVHLLRALAVRLHMCAGFAKLTSGDPLWAGLTALAVHHETQVRGRVGVRARLRGRARARVWARARVRVRVRVRARVS